MVKLATKTYNLFCNITAKQVKGDVAHFATHIQTCVTTNKGCCNYTVICLYYYAQKVCNFHM